MFQQKVRNRRSLDKVVFALDFKKRSVIDRSTACLPDAKPDFFKAMTERFSFRVMTERFLMHKQLFSKLFLSSVPPIN